MSCELILVGSPGLGDEDAGFVSVLEPAEASWGEVERLVPSVFSPGFGSAVALDGALAVVGQELADPAIESPVITGSAVPSSRIASMAVDSNELSVIVGPDVWIRTAPAEPLPPYRRTQLSRMQTASSETSLNCSSWRTSVRRRWVPRRDMTDKERESGGRKLRGTAAHRRRPQVGT